MADYIYTMEIRLTPDQQKGVTLVQEVARAAGMNVDLTGGAIRDIISGFQIRDLDFIVQGNPLRLQKELERAGARVGYADDDVKALHLVFFFQAEDGIRDYKVTGVQTCALPI